jgi:hypothetical protein
MSLRSFCETTQFIGPSEMINRRGRGEHTEFQEREAASLYLCVLRGNPENFVVRI